MSDDYIHLLILEGFPAPGTPWDLFRFASGDAVELQRLMDDIQEDVTGTVRLKLYKGNVMVAGRKSPRSLYRTDYVTFEADRVYRQKDAEGFINLNALRLKIRALRDAR